MRLTLLLFALALTGCAADVDGVHVSGIAPMHADDIRAALAVARQDTTKTASKIYAVQVISSDEIHVFRGSKDFPGFQLLRRVHGKWKDDGTVFWTE